ncbi:hypothetical protein [Vibrio maritimus]|uniref:hypothetical protein n=1 Tax=Vibrio maritimus TaxID=990268 RepID=UPI001F27B2B9|nr:hypothetical protein [Vibrio maritimus]
MSIRIKLGTTIVLVTVPMPLIAPVVIPFLGLDAALTAAAIATTIATSEVLLLCAIPILGKQGFIAIKNKYFFWLKIPERLKTKWSRFFSRKNKIENKSRGKL